MCGITGIVARDPRGSVDKARLKRMRDVLRHRGPDKGREEFGAGSLGNRSILADPRNTEVVRDLNEAIKARDFWMPFCSSVLAERSADYLVNDRSSLRHLAIGNWLVSKV